MLMLQARGVLEVPLRENKCKPLADAFGKHMGLSMPQVCTSKVQLLVLTAAYQVSRQHRHPELTNVVDGQAVQM